MEPKTEVKLSVGYYGIFLYHQSLILVLPVAYSNSKEAKEKAYAIAKLLDLPFNENIVTANSNCQSFSKALEVSGWG